MIPDILNAELCQDLFNTRVMCGYQKLLILNVF